MVKLTCQAFAPPGGLEPPTLFLQKPSCCQKDWTISCPIYIGLGYIVSTHLSFDKLVTSLSKKFSSGLSFDAFRKEGVPRISPILHIVLLRSAAN